MANANLELKAAQPTILQLTEPRWIDLVPAIGFCTYTVRLYRNYRNRTQEVSDEELKEIKTQLREGTYLQKHRAENRKIVLNTFQIPLVHFGYVILADQLARYMA
jgi:hypothetical protein